MQKRATIRHSYPVRRDDHHRKMICLAKRLVDEWACVTFQVLRPKINDFHRAPPITLARTYPKDALAQAKKVKNDQKKKKRQKK